jgi:anti-sigma B factor antagonist
MKSEDSAGMMNAAIAGMPSGNRQRNHDKFDIVLDPGYSGSAVVLRCQGRNIFRNETRALSNLVAEVLPSARRMVIDLSGIDSIDSGGLGELVLLYLWAGAAGYALMFAGPKESVRRLFEITGVDSVFEVYASVPEAMSAMVQEEVRSA